SNPEGGLLVVGISRVGEILGINHLTDAQRNEICNIGQLLRNYSAEVRIHDCKTREGDSRKLLLIYVSYTPDAICETLEATPRAWKRAGAQNVPLTERDRDQLRRDKRIVSFERSFCCSYSAEDLDRELLSEIRTTWPNVMGSERS